MRPINVSLDATTWELAKNKTNFSSWVRDQLRAERNKTNPEEKFCNRCYAKWPKNTFYDHPCLETQKKNFGPVATWVSVGEEE